MGAIQDLYPGHLLMHPNKWTEDSEQDLAAKKWSGSDTRALFEQNLRKQPADWYYRTHPVTYQFNSNNYRCPEWADIAWQDSWVMLGCSIVEGVGLALDDCVSSRLSQVIKAPVVNLGVGGAGLDVTMFNSMRLLEAGIRPKGVILLHGNHNLARVAVFSPNIATLVGSWVLGRPKTDGFPVDTLFKLWTRHANNAEAHAQMNLAGALALWKCANIPVFSISTNTLSSTTDRARDIMHPGPITAKDWAQQIAAIMQKQQS